MENPSPFGRQRPAELYLNLIEFLPGLHQMLEYAEREIDIGPSSAILIAEDVTALEIIEYQARRGARVRIMFRDPKSMATTCFRNVEYAAGSISAALTAFRAINGVEIRSQRTDMYGSIYRADECVYIAHHFLGVPDQELPIFKWRGEIGEALNSATRRNFDDEWSKAIGSVTGLEWKG